MRQMYYLCTDMKRGYVRDRWGDVGLWPAYQDRPHVVMFFSEVQPYFKILSLYKCVLIFTLNITIFTFIHVDMKLQLSSICIVL